MVKRSIFFQSFHWFDFWDMQPHSKLEAKGYDNWHCQVSWILQVGVDGDRPGFKRHPCLEDCSYLIGQFLLFWFFWLGQLAILWYWRYLIVWQVVYVYILVDICSFFLFKYIKLVVMMMMMMMMMMMIPVDLHLLGRSYTDHPRDRLRGDCPSVDWAHLRNRFRCSSSVPANLHKSPMFAAWKWGYTSKMGIYHQFLQCYIQYIPIFGCNMVEKSHRCPKFPLVGSLVKGLVQTPNYNRTLLVYRRHLSKALSKAAKEKEKEPITL